MAHRWLSKAIGNNVEKYKRHFMLSIAHGLSYPDTSCNKNVVRTKALVSESPPAVPFRDKRHPSHGCRGYQPVRVVETVSELAALCPFSQRLVFPIGSWAGLKLFGYPPHSCEASDFAHRQIAERKVDLQLLYSRSESFAKYAKAVESLEKQETVKILFRPS